MLEEFSPVDFGLPSIFSSWRPLQTEAVRQVFESDKRINALAMPTGSGKSLTIMTLVRLLGWRTVILTGTKGLMDQYLSEFSLNPIAAKVYAKMGVRGKVGVDELVDIRGKANYQCSDFAHLNCDDGMRSGCRKCTGYTPALELARHQNTVITNYDYWLNLNRASKVGLSRVIKPNPVDLLVLDEAHLAPERLAAFLAIRITTDEIKNLIGIAAPVNEHDMGEWVDFARLWHKAVEKQSQHEAKQIAASKGTATRKQIDDAKRLEALAGKLERLKSIKRDAKGQWGWVVEPQTPTHSRGVKRWEFDPVWPGLYAENSLFCGIPHILLVSATLRPKTLSLLGVKGSDYKFREWDRVFPPNRNPLYSIPAKKRGENGEIQNIRINYRTPYHDMLRWVEQIDDIIATRLDRKGIIHTVSYDRQQFLMARSRFAPHMIGNTSDPASPKADKIVHDFKQAAAPAILVSPSFSTGWDFPYDECEWQIIMKVPFPNSRSKVMKERMKRDPRYLDYLAMQDLVQACGRGMRAEDDRCENFIVDANIAWFIARNKALAPKWFDPKSMANIPNPPISIADEREKRKADAAKKSARHRSKSAVA